MPDFGAPRRDAGPRRPRASGSANRSGSASRSKSASGSASEGGSKNKNPNTSKSERATTLARTRLRRWAPPVFSALVQVPAALAQALRADDLPLALRLGAVVLALAGPLALLLLRRHPGPMVAAVVLFAGVDFLVAHALPGPPYVALVFAIVIAVRRGARLWAWVAVVAVWSATVTVATVSATDIPAGRIAVTSLGLLLLLGLSEGLRTRHERFAAFRRAAAQRREEELQAERVRIAREVHDVLAHSLSQINVQADVGLHLMERRPEQAAQALRDIKDASHRGLDEVRALLGVLRADGDAPLRPEPDLDRLPELVESSRRQGLDVQLSGGWPDAPPAVQLAGYRIVQESLTNVLRHAQAEHVRIALTHDQREYRVEVADDGRGPAASGVERSEGRGLLGMRERADLLGGHLEIHDEGGMRVVAVLPRRDIP